MYLKNGDIAVFTGGEFGHVSICYGEGDINSFKTIDQNWKPQQLTDEWHDYFYLAPIVFLRPKNQSNINPAFPYDVEVFADVLNVRWEPSLDSGIKTFDELTPNAREQILNLCGYKANGLVKGCVATVYEINNNFGKIPSGWISMDWVKRL